MFNTSLHPITFLFICIDIVLIIGFFIAYFIKRNTNRYSFKYLIITTLCLIYNINNGLIIGVDFIDLTTKYYITYAIGICTGCYLFYYMYDQHNIKGINFQHVIGLILGALFWYIFSFVILYALTSNFFLSRTSFFLYPILVGIWVFFRFSKHYNASFYNLNNYLKARFYSGVIAFVLFYIFHIVLIIYDNPQALERTIFNSAHLVLSYFYFVFFIHKNVNMTAIITQKKQFDVIFSMLTSREKDVLRDIYLKQDLNYTALADQLNISMSTFTTHTTNIYKKLKLQDKSRHGLNGYLKQLEKTF